MQTVRIVALALASYLIFAPAYASLAQSSLPVGGVCDAVSGTCDYIRNQCSLIGNELVCQGKKLKNSLRRLISPDGTIPEDHIATCRQLKDVLDQQDTDSGTYCAAFTYLSPEWDQCIADYYQRNSWYLQEFHRLGCYDILLNY